jgi:MFS family permease
MIKPRLALSVLTVIYVINFIDRQLIAVLAPAIKQDFFLSNTQIGLLYGASFSFIYAFWGIPMGWLADRVNRKGLLLISLVLWSLATFATGWATSVLALLSLRIALAIFESAASPVSYSLITDLFDQKEWGKRISIYASGIFIGIGASFLLGGSLAEWFSWRDAFIYAGYIGLIVALISVFLIPNMVHQTPKRQQIATWSAFKDIFSRYVIWFHLLGFGFLALSGYALLSFLSSHLVALGRPDLVKHYGWFMFGVAIMVSLSGKWADFLAQAKRCNRFIPGIVAAWGGLPLYWLGLSSSDGLHALIFIGFGALIASSYNGVAAATLQDLVPHHVRGLAGGVYLFVISIGGFGLGPFLTGWIADTFFSGVDSIAQALKIILTSSGLMGGLFLLKAKNLVKNHVDE